MTHRKGIDTRGGVGDDGDMREPRPARIADETAPTRGAGFESRLGHTARAIATWSDDHGSTYTWPQATVDNRRSRVLARIARFEIPCNPTTLTIVDVS